MRIALVAVILGACSAAPRIPSPLTEDPAVVVGCRPDLVTGTRAKRVDCSGELVRGYLAAGRLGDIVMENARVKIIIRAAGDGYYQHGSFGGGIVDAVANGGEDLIKEVLPLVDLAVATSDEVVITEAGDDGLAEVVVRGRASALDIMVAALSRQPPAVTIEHRYRLRADTAAVEIQTRIWADDPTERSLPLYDGLFLGGRARAFLPGKGFVDGTGSAEIIATDGTSTSYGIAYPSGQPNPQLADFASIRFALGGDVDDQGLLRYFIIGDGSVASVTETGWRLRGQEVVEIRGTAPPRADIVVRRDDAVLTVGRADDAGTYRLAVPAGMYELRAEQAGRTPGPARAVTVAGEAVEANLLAGRGGTLRVSVHDGAAPLPARVTIAANGASSKQITWTDASGSRDIKLEPGTYEIVVSRGVEYDAFVATSIVVGDGAVVPLDVSLSRVVDTIGWISLDTHLHSELSTDSTMPIDDRLRAVAGEGVEVAVATDHDVIADYGPTIEALGLERWLHGVSGAETSSIVWGHVNGYPLRADPARTGRG
nr:hypothetical protein [Deltaproteobacteria bacterium]